MAVGSLRSLRGAAVVALAATLLVVGGCETLGFYSQAVFGQIGVLNKRQPVDALVAELEGDPDSADLLAGLKASQEILAFAEAELGIDVGKRYRTYVELGSPHVVWNVFAAPEFDLQPRTWCYPMVGCAPYRGYFDEARAQRFADKLAADGLDVYLGGVAAYSTLGWFEDPLLSSFIAWPQANLAELLVHELAHGQVWVKGDVEFNEAFATFVGRQGAARWMQARQGSVGVTEYLQRRSQWRSMVDLLLETRAALRGVYAGDLDDSGKRMHKAAVLERAAACYQTNRDVLGGGRFDSVMGRVNNAYLVSLATYQNNVPAFARIFAEQDGDWPKFYAAVVELGQLPDEERAQRLDELREQHEAHAGDDERADQIQCKALLGHGLDGKAPGAEHDYVRRGGHRQHESAGSAHGRRNHDELGV
jgi:predicted aminopeptidase